MNSFKMNGILWRIYYVDNRSFESVYLVDRTGRMTLATTDPTTYSVYIDNELGGELLVRVLIHELAHCAMYSFDLLSDIHRMTKRRHWIEMEEWICNFIADYGMNIFQSAYSIMGYDAIQLIPYEFERLVS